MHFIYSHKYNANWAEDSSDSSLMQNSMNLSDEPHS